MRRALYVLYFSMALGTLLCTRALEPAQAQSRDEREIRALLDRAFAAGNTLDERVWRQNLADHSPSGGPFFPPFAASLGSLRDVEALVTQHQGQLSAHSYAATSPMTLRVDKNLAWGAYTWRAELSFKDGTRSSLEGRATVSFVREGKNWKFAHWHSSLTALPPFTSSARDAEAQKVIEVERNAWEAIKAKQPAKLADYFAEDASIFIEGQAYRIRGKANLLRGLTAFIESTDLRSYQMLEPQVQVLGDTALLTYYFTESGASGGKEVTSAGKISMLFVKQGGAWRALHEHRSVNR